MGRRIRVKTDRISELPLFLLHQILSYLPRKDAVITSVLSKHWNSVWHSFPILKFHDCVYLQEQLNGTPEYAEKFGKFLDFVDESLRKFTQNNLRMEILDLDMTLIDVKSFPMIDTWIPLALQNDASEIHFWVSDVTGYQYPLPETTFAVKSNPGSSPFYHLQTLSLSNICLSENIIRDIIRNCPNITDLSLRDCCSLKTLELSKLEKLERLFISEDEIERLTVDAPWLEDFTFQSCDMEQNLPCVIQLTSCNALRKLKLYAVAITDDWLNSYISRSPLLESLFIFHGNMLRNVRISSNQLKSVVLRQLWQLEVLQIHAPNLSYFEFHTIKSIILLSEDVIPCAVNITHSPYGPLDSFWFLKLRQFLGVSAQSINLTLSSYKNKVSFDLEALRDVAIPPLVNIDLLDLTYVVVLSQLDCAVLIDGLLWSCHPKAISFAVTSNRNTCIKVLCEKLWGIEQPLCCESSHFKCWRHGLKSVKIESFGRIEVERLFDLNILLDSLSLRGKGEEVRFILDWAFEDIKT